MSAQSAENCTSNCWRWYKTNVWLIVFCDGFVAKMSAPKLLIYSSCCVQSQMPAVSIRNQVNMILFRGCQKYFCLCPFFSFYMNKKLLSLTSSCTELAAKLTTVEVILYNFWSWWRKSAHHTFMVQEFVFVVFIFK